MRARDLALTMMAIFVIAGLWMYYADQNRDLGGGNVVPIA